MEYSVEQIIVAALNGKTLSPERKGSNRFILRTGEGEFLQESDARKVRELVALIERKLNVKLRLVGGGSGCTKFEFEIIETCALSASEIIKKILNDNELLSRAVETKFKVIVDPSRASRQNIEELIVENKPQGNFNLSISDSTINGIQVGTRRSSQNVSTSSTIATSLEMVLNELEKAVSTLDERNVENKDDLVSDVASLKAEFKRSKPRNQIITGLLNSLGSIASLTAFADQVYPFIPSIS